MIKPFDGNGMGPVHLRLRRPASAPLTGSWIDFHHPNPKEGDYWNEATLRFTAGDWDNKIEEMAGFGIDTVIIGSVMLRGRTFYPSTLVEEKWNHACDDPVEAVLAGADRHGCEVYMGIGFFSQDTGRTEADSRERHLRKEMPVELHSRYGRHPSFRGWYLPVEGAIKGLFSDAYLQYVNELASACRAPDARRKILIAPYGTRTVEGDSRFEEQLRKLEVDWIAYQDEVGVRKTDPHELGGIFRKLRECHDRAGLPLWADIEIFAFEGPVYDSRLVPAPFDRVKAQIEEIAPYADKLLCYQYLGMVNPPASTFFAGHPSSADFYSEYVDWRRAVLKNR